MVELSVLEESLRLEFFRFRISFGIMRVGPTVKHIISLAFPDDAPAELRLREHTIC